jgi:hypothetical protein
MNLTWMTGSESFKVASITGLNYTLLNKKKTTPGTPNFPQSSKEELTLHSGVFAFLLISYRPIPHQMQTNLYPEKSLK